MRRLDRAITIQQRVDATSPSGEPIVGWNIVEQRRPATMQSLTGEERFASPQEVAKEQVEFRILFSENVADISPLNRVLHPALTDAEAEDPDFVPAERRIHDVLAVLEVGRAKRLRIITERRVDVLG